MATDNTWAAIRRNGYAFAFDLYDLAASRGELTPDMRQKFVELCEAIGNTYVPDPNREPDKRG